MYCHSLWHLSHCILPLMVVTSTQKHISFILPFTTYALHVQFWEGSLYMYVWIYSFRGRFLLCSPGWPGTHYVETGWLQTHRAACFASWVLQLKAWPPHLVHFLDLLRKAFCVQVWIAGDWLWSLSKARQGNDPLSTCGSWELLCHLLP